MRDLKRRIRAVTNIQHLTGAMKMVAAAKLRRAQAQVWAARPYANKMSEVVSRLAPAPKAQSLPLVVPREVKKTGYVLITADKGLAGAYNANLIKLAEDTLTKNKKPSAMVLIGRKGVQHFRRQSVEILDYYVDFGDIPQVTQARALARQLMDMFLKEEVDEVNLIYARFISALHHDPQVERLLPLVTSSVQGIEETEYIYEPEPVGILTAILPRYCEIKVYQALLEAKASEESARVIAMDNATENAGEVIDKLNLSFNKARQSAITTEILEVASGAEALKAR
ncbi:MAG: ATP synthase F1 subunit gamma [Dethiobacteria bacterium]